MNIESRVHGRLIAIAELNGDDPELLATVALNLDNVGGLVQRKLLSINEDCPNSSINVFKLLGIGGD